MHISKLYYIYVNVRNINLNIGSFKSVKFPDIFSTTYFLEIADAPRFTKTFVYNIIGIYTHIGIFVSRLFTPL